MGASIDNSVILERAVFIELLLIANKLHAQNLEHCIKVSKRKKMFDKTSYAAGYNAALEFMSNQISNILTGKELHHLERE